MATNSPHHENTSLSDEMEDLISNYFDPQVQSAARAILLFYAATRPEPATERVLFDLVHLSAGNLDKLKHLAELATEDPRDIMSQEYFRVDGKYYPHPWARRHAVNRDSPEPQQNLP